MASIELSTEEVTLVANALESRLSRLVSEINHADTRDFRDQLKQQATTIEHILARLPKSESRKVS